MNVRRSVHTSHATADRRFSRRTTQAYREALSGYCPRGLSRSLSSPLYLINRHAQPQCYSDFFPTLTMLSPEMADPRESSHPTSSRPSSTWTVLDLESEARQVHNTNSTPITTQRPGLLKRVTTFCFNLRTLGRRQQREAHDLPLQQPKLDPWPPLHIEKRSGQCCEHCVKHRKRRRRNQLLWLLIVILLLYLLGNTVALDVLTYTGGDSTSSVSAVLSANQQLCLSEFEINAPVNASLYPCSTCLSTLQGVSSDFLKEHTQDAAQIQNAIQFCALRGVFVEAGGQGQSSLGNGGWMQNNQVCGWSGIGCNSEGQVTSLYVVVFSCARLG